MISMWVYNHQWAVSHLCVPFRCWSGGVSRLTCGPWCGSCCVTLRTWPFHSTTQIFWRAPVLLRRWCTETCPASSHNTSSFRSSGTPPARSHCLTCWRLDDLREYDYTSAFEEYRYHNVAFITGLLSLRPRDWLLPGKCVYCRPAAHTGNELIFEL